MKVYPRNNSWRILSWLAIVWLSACSTASDPQLVPAPERSVHPIRFGHVALSVKDAARSAQWYSEIFGFVQIGGVYDIKIDESPLGQVAAKLFRRQAGGIRIAQLATTGGLAIELFEFEASKTTSESQIYPKTGIIHFAIVVDAFEETLQKLEDGGAELIVKNLANPNRLVAFYHDLDGNIIEISSREWGGM